MLDLLCRLDTNDDPDDGWEGTSVRRCVMSTSLCRMSVRLRKQRGLTTRNRAAKARCDCAPGWGEVGKRGGDGTTRKRTRREPFQGKSNPWMQWARGIVSTQALCTNICTAAAYRLVSRLAISLGLSPPRAREESRLFATPPTARNSLQNIVWESKKLRTKFLRQRPRQTQSRFLWTRFTGYSGYHRLSRELAMIMRTWGRDEKTQFPGFAHQR